MLMKQRILMFHSIPGCCVVGKLALQQKILINAKILRNKEPNRSLITLPCHSKLQMLTVIELPKRYENEAGGIHFVIAYELWENNSYNYIWRTVCFSSLITR